MSKVLGGRWDPLGRNLELLSSQGKKKKRQRRTLRPTELCHQLAGWSSAACDPVWTLTPSADLWRAFCLLPQEEVAERHPGPSPTALHRPAGWECW